MFYPRKRDHRMTSNKPNAVINTGEWKTVYKKKINKPKPKGREMSTGKRSDCQLKTVHRKVEYFITGFHPDKNSDDIIEHINLINLNTSEASCTAIKIHYDTYASFHLTVRIEKSNDLYDSWI